MNSTTINAVRKPILTAGEKYQTIAAHNQNYEPCEVMGTYPDINTARSHYQQDMDNSKMEGKGYQHFAIRKVTVNPEQTGGELC